MIQQFAGLSQEEQQAMVDAVPLITLLIAGADGNIDSAELEWSKKLTEIRSYTTADDHTESYYQMVGESFEGRINGLLLELPDDQKAREVEITNRLSALNDILPKLEANLGQHFHKSFVSFAQHVAKASGGFLGMGSISKEEAELISLPMIQPL